MEGAAVLSPEAVERGLAELEPLVEVSHAVQAEIREFRERHDRVAKDEPLPPKSLRELADGRRRYLALQDRLLELARRFEAPATAAAADRLVRDKALGIALVAALTVYDNYLSLLTVLDDERFRRLIAHPGYGYGMPEDELWSQIEALNAAGARRRLMRLVDAWEARAGERPDDAVLQRIEKAVAASASYRHASSATLDGHLPTAWRLRRTRFMDTLSGLGEEALGAISEIFGNGIGMVELRDGKLRGDESLRTELLGVLQPLDLLLEKTPFRLTDAFIPGHFGHVAIWMGTEAELDALGVFDEPPMQEPRLAGSREAIQERRSVLEALRTGVALNTLAHFLNVDDLAVLRPRELTPRERVESLVRGFEQVGKEYDFNFDVETIGSIVCSELPYHVYPGVAWHTESSLGRFTISPDDVAAQALSESGRFELVRLHHDGVRIDDETALDRMRSLISDG